MLFVVARFSRKKLGTVIFNESARTYTTGKSQRLSKRNHPILEATLLLLNLNETWLLMLLTSTIDSYSVEL